MPFDITIIHTASLLAYALVFLGGVLTSLGPCNVTTIPLIVGYVGASHDLPRRRAFTISLAFAMGLAITFMLLGIVEALMGSQGRGYIREIFLGSVSHNIARYAGVSVLLISAIRCIPAKIDDGKRAFQHPSTVSGNIRSLDHDKSLWDESYGCYTGHLQRR
jgi:hypothetical protein